MIDNETKKHGIQDNISPQKSEDTKPIKHKSTANDKSIPCYERAISKGMQEDLTLLKHLSTGRIQGKRGRAKELRVMLEKEGFTIPKKSA